MRKQKPPIQMNTDEWNRRVKEKDWYFANLEGDDETAKTKSGNRDSSSAPNVEQVTGHALCGEKQAKCFDSPVYIHVCSYRHKLADTDGVSAKAAIDGIVASGLLKDDNAAWVDEVRYRQIKIPGTEEEKTIITLEEI